jgi:hypothetical protein
VSKDGLAILATYSGNTKCRQSVDGGANWQEINNTTRPSQGCLALDKEGTRGIIGEGSSGTCVWLGSRVLDLFVPQIAIF